MASSTWSISHTPAAGGSATTYALADHDITGIAIEFVNWGMDTASITVARGSPAFAAAAFAYRDKIVILRDGVAFFVGWVTGLGLSAEAEPQSRTYTLSGPSWWLANLPYVWPYWPVKADLDVGERLGYVWLGSALDSAINYSAPIDRSAYGNFTIACPDLRASSTCLEVVQRVARLHPMSAGWWDYSTTEPTFRAALRADHTPQSIAIGGALASFGFTPLPALQALSVRIAYTYELDDGTTATDYEGAGPYPETIGPNRLHFVVEVGDAQASADAQGFQIADIIYASLADLPWAGTLNFDAALGTVPAVRPGMRINVTGGRSEWATMEASVQSVQWSISSGAADACTVTLGAPEQLGPQDLLEFARAGSIAGGGGGGNLSPYDPPGPPPPPPGENDSQPGTYDDLNDLLGGAPTGSILVQSRGGSWSLVGWASFDGSDPLRRWRTHTVDGSITLNDTSYYQPATFTGTRSYSATTGVLSGTYLCNGSEEFVGEGIETGAACEWWVGFCVNAGYTLTQSQTVRTYTLGGSCTGAGAASGFRRYVATNEDTEADAWDRVLADAGTYWRTDVTTAIRTIPTTGTTGVRRELRFGTYVAAAMPYDEPIYTPLGGLVHWQRYRLVATLERRTVHEGGGDTGIWEPAGTVYSSPWIGDLSGQGGAEWTYIEPTPGYETRISDLQCEQF